MIKSTKRIRPNKAIKPKVALDSPMVEENLPFPYVYYPNHYGSFFMFSKSKDEQPVFCECNKVAIENYFKLKYLETSKYADERVSAPLSNHIFPNYISEKSLLGEVTSLLNFEKKLCHRCNMATPSLRYCHEMYGGNFSQYYGWYINQTMFRLGIRGTFYLENYTPNFIIEKIKLGSNLSNLIENITREEFGFRKIGEGNISETILIKIVEKLYPSNIIFKHHRPKWLNGLELDVFLPELKLAFEYQGQQHFYPIKAWGGLKILKELRLRDEKKRKICSEVGIKLIEVDYTEPLEENYILKKICV